MKSDEDLNQLQANESLFELMSQCGCDLLLRVSISQVLNFLYLKLVLFDRWIIYLPFVIA